MLWLSVFRVLNTYYKCIQKITERIEQTTQTPCELVHSML